MDGRGCVAIPIDRTHTEASSSSSRVDLPPDAPPGLQYREAAATHAVWQQLEAWLAEDSRIPWEFAPEGRRVAQWGYRYDYSSHRVDRTPLEPIPNILTQLLHAEPEPERFTQCIINEYGADDGEKKKQHYLTHGAGAEMSAAHRNPVA